MIQNNYEVDVLINGNPAKEYFKDGKIYLEGRKGVEYSIRIKNNSGKRIVAVPTVDGLSVMDGKEASYKSQGYIINAYDSLTVKGWRKSDKEVAAFFFSDPSESYGARTDKSSNLGVIGVAITPEKERVVEKEIIRIVENYPHQLPCYTHWPRYCISCSHYHCTCQPCVHRNLYVGGNVSMQCGNLSAGITGSGQLNSLNVSNANGFNLKADATPNYSAFSMKSVSQDVGTGWGEVKRSEVVTVEFEKANQGPTIFQLFYNTREQLEALGVDFRTKPVYVSPQAFPAQYCEPPRK